MDTPMLDKIREAAEEMELCGNFLEWFLHKYTVFEKNRERESSYEDITGPGDYVNEEKLLAEFFEIDLKEAEKERRETLAEFLQIDLKKEETAYIEDDVTATYDLVRQNNIRGE